jgi:acetoin utilization deacetylase AcuC-like enzyme
MGRGAGYTMNIPLKALTPARDQLRIFETALQEISSKIKPDLVLISAGFDSHRDDPLGQLLLEDPDFISMTNSILEWAAETCNGRVVSCLEGGYNLETLGPTVKAHVRALLGQK